MTLEQLKLECEQCQKCRLCATRTKVVFGVGVPNAKVLFVGEGPGANEDRQGEPFVGAAGQLLDKMLRAASFSRSSNVYIANMVKCRPPQNRDPAADEISACIGYLREQVRLIRPRYIVCLGRIAAQNLIGEEFRVTRQHGEFIQRGNTWMMGTFHPAALLRNAANKPAAFADLLALRDRIAAEQAM
jgi:uracil-DNA glycosylase, family 4